MSTNAQKISALNRMMKIDNRPGLRGRFTVGEDSFYCCPYYAIMNMKPLIDNEVSGFQGVAHFFYSEEVQNIPMPSFKMLKEYIKENRHKFKALGEPITMVWNDIKFNCQYLYDIYLLMDYDKQDEITADFCKKKMCLLFNHGKERNCRGLLMLIRYNPFFN